MSFSRCKPTNQLVRRERNNEATKKIVTKTTSVLHEPTIYGNLQLSTVNQFSLVTYLYPTFYEPTLHFIHCPDCHS